MSAWFVMGIAVFAALLPTSGWTQECPLYNSYQDYAISKSWVTVEIVVEDTVTKTNYVYVENAEALDDYDGDGISNGREFEGWASVLSYSNETLGIVVGQPVVYTHSAAMTNGVDIEFVFCGPDLEKRDADRDGLSDRLEEDAGTNPNNSDTDGDGMIDSWEAYVGLDPNDAGYLNPLNLGTSDPDGDGLSNAEEMSTVASSPVISGPADTADITVYPITDSACPYSYPLAFDTDNDGLVDSYEHKDNKYGLNAIVDERRRDVDSDLDGLTTFREQCVHPLMASFNSGNSLPIPAPLTGLPVSSRATVRYIQGTQGALVCAGYLNLANYDNALNTQLAPGNVIWGHPVMTSRWLKPNNADSDGDMLPDGWEVEHGLSPLTGRTLVENGRYHPSGPLGDPDGDGKVNLEEYYGQDGYRINYITGTGDETIPWISRAMNNTVGNTFANTGIGQPSFGSRSYQSPSAYLGIYGDPLTDSFTGSYAPNAPLSLVGFFDPAQYASGLFVPVLGAPPPMLLDDRLDVTYSQFNPFAVTVAGMAFLDKPGSEDGVYTPGVDDCWLDVNGDGIFEFIDDLIIVDTNGLAGGEVMTGLLTENVPYKWPMPGYDSDDDGFPDDLEIERDISRGKYPSCAVDPLDPFNPKSMRVLTGAGIELPPTSDLVAPDVGNPALGSRTKRRHFSRSFTVETWVYLEGNGTEDFRGAFVRGQVSLGGLSTVDGYNLGVDRNAQAAVTNLAVPYFSFQTLGGTRYKVTAGRSIPLNRWVHLAGVFEHENNALSLYIDGLLEQSRQTLEESSARWGINNGGVVVLAQDAPGGATFANRLWMDEVRIWGSPRMADEVADNRNVLINPCQEPPISKYPDLFSVTAITNYSYAQQSVIVTNWTGTNATDYVIYTNLVTVTNMIISAETNHVINALLAYFTFDDGGKTAQDFTKRAKSSLLGYAYPYDLGVVARLDQEYLYGDMLYALTASRPTGPGVQTDFFAFDNNRAAPVRGQIDAERGALDSDGDGLPDAWELVMEFNPFREFTPNHNKLVQMDPDWAILLNTVADAQGDPDNDGLSTLYEYWARTNPRKWDTDENGVPDTEEDFERDGLPNRLEYLLKSRPDLADTDDDGDGDGVEQGANTDPGNSLSPPKTLGAFFDGVEGSWLDIPSRSDFRLNNFTLEALVLPSADLATHLGDGEGATILRKVEQVTVNRFMAANYELRVVRVGNYLTPEIRYVSVDGLSGIGTASYVRGNPAGDALHRIPMDMSRNLSASFSHIAASYDYVSGTLRLYLNDRLIGQKAEALNRPPITGKGPLSFVRMGEGFVGAINEARVWSITRSATEISATSASKLTGRETGLVGYYRFDDGAFPVRQIFRPVAGVLSVPPAAPTANDRYVIGAGPVGIWAGKMGYVAEYDGVGWNYETPVKGARVKIENGAWLQYDSASGQWGTLDSVIPSVRYATAPTAPQSGDSWLSGNRIVRYDNGVTYTSSVAQTKVFCEGAMLLGTASPGEFSWWSSRNEMYRLFAGAPNVWRRWGNNRNWLSTVMVRVKEAYATEAALLAARNVWDTFSGDDYLVQGPTPYIYTYTMAADPNQAAGYETTPVYTGNRILNEANGQILESAGAGVFNTIANASTDGGDLYVLINVEGAVFKSDGSIWRRWGYIPTFEDFTLTNGWSTQWAKSARLYGNVCSAFGLSEEETPPSDLTDSDNDGLPDWWELLYFGNLSQGATGDPDGDSLQNLYEYLAGTNPTVKETNPGTGDYEFDSDGDGLTNGEEQFYTTNPGRRDTDDDGVSDYVEVDTVRVNPKPAGWQPMSALHSLGRYSPTNYSLLVTCANFPKEGVVVPDGASGNPSASSSDWTVETWFYSDALPAQSGSLIRKMVGTQSAYDLGIQGGVPYVRISYSHGTTYRTNELKAINGTLSVSTWAHLAATWNSTKRKLSLFVNGTIAYEKDYEEETWTALNGVGEVRLADSTAGAFSGTTLMDNVRIWDVSRTLQQNDATRLKRLIAKNYSGLQRDYRFDDGGATVEDFAHSLQSVGDLGYESYALNPSVYGIRYGTSGQIAWLSSTAVTGLYDEALNYGDNVPDWWMSAFQLTEANEDADGDQVVNLYEFMGKTDPTRQRTDGATLDSQRIMVSGMTLLQEQTYQSDPRFADTDGDGEGDSQEIRGDPERDGEDWPVSDPTTPLQNDPGVASPQMIRRSVSFNGASRMELQAVGNPGKYALEDWTIDAWVRPTAATSGTVIRRQVQTVVAGGEMINYELGVEASGGRLYPYVRYVGEFGPSILAVRIGGSTASGVGDLEIPLNEWTHLAGRYSSSTNVLTLFVNGMPVVDNSDVSALNKPYAPIAGKSEAVFSIGEGFVGMIDEVKIWGAALSSDSLFSNFRSSGTAGQRGYDIGENGQPETTVIRPPTPAEAMQQGLEFEPNKLLVKFAPHVSALTRDAVLRSLGGQVTRRFEFIGLDVVQFDGARPLETVMTSLNTNTAVKYAELNMKVRVNRRPNDPNFALQWGLENTGQAGGVAGADIQAVAAWDVGTGSRDVVVAVIDTGVEYTHPDLKDNMWVNSGEIPANGIDDDGNGYVDDYYGYDFANEDGDPLDDYGHGTHCAGVIGAAGNNGVGISGINWNVRIMAIKFLSAAGGGTWEGAIASVEYAAKMGAKISNNSWGGYGYSQGLYDAIEAAGRQGHLFVTSAGNEMNDNDGIFPAYPASFDLNNIITVAASDSADQLAWFSNYGATSVDLAAPGVSIFSTIIGEAYSEMSGTSMACPHVAGVAALLKSLNPAMTFADLKAAILSGTDPKLTFSGKMVTGGRLNAASALTASGGLIGHFRMDDGSVVGGAAMAQDMTVYNDVVFGFRHAARLAGNAAFNTNEYAAMTGDSDNDGMPDWFETAYRVDDYAADTDGDGLTDLYEYYAGTNPRQVDSFFDGTTDDQRDSDGDGLDNEMEQITRTHAGLPDTDDDGSRDGTEVDNHTSPIISLVPTNSLALRLTGTSPAVALPNQPRFGLDKGWTVEGWVQPATNEADGGILVARYVGDDGINYELGLTAVGGNLFAYAALSDIVGNYRELVQATNTAPIARALWSHLAATFDPTAAELKLFVNGSLRGKLSTTFVKPPAAAQAGRAEGVIGDGLIGLVDEIRIWSGARSVTNIVELMYPAIVGNEPGLIAYYRFDDGTSYRPSPFIGTSAGDDADRFSVGQIQDFVERYYEDWNRDWFNGATILDPTVGFVVNDSLPMAELDSDGDGLPDWWEYYYFGNLTTTEGSGDYDGDGLTDKQEYLAGTDPTNPNSFGDSDGDGEIDSDGDGISNRDEQNIYGTDPGRWDTDDDGVSDGVEIRKLTSPLHPMSVYHADKSLLNQPLLRSLDASLVAEGGIELPMQDRFVFSATNAGWTVEFWFRRGSATNGVFFEYQGAGNDTMILSLYNGTPYGQIFDSQGNLAVDVGGPLLAGTSEGLIPLPEDRWIHLAFVWAPEDMTFRILRNGELLTARQTAHIMASSGGRAFIAKNLENGYMDEIRIWNRVRSDSEVRDWYQKIYPTPGYVSNHELGLLPPDLSYRYNDLLYSVTKYDQFWALLELPIYQYGQPLIAYYRFDDGGNYIEDFAHLNDSRYYLQSGVSTKHAYIPLGFDDADGDGLPEWYLDMYDSIYYTEYNLGPYHRLQQGHASDYPITLAAGWRTADGTEGKNKRVYYLTQASIQTNGLPLIAYNVWLDIDPEPTTNDTLRENYEGKGIYNETWDERVFMDAGVWFIPDGTAGMNQDLSYNGTGKEGMYENGNDIWINVPGGRSGTYDLQDVVGIDYYRTFTSYGSIGAGGAAWFENNKFITTKDSGVGYDGMFSAFHKYIYIDAVPASASLKLILFNVDSYELYINGVIYDQAADTDGQTLLSLLKRGRNSVYLETVNTVYGYVKETDVHYSADYSREYTHMKFDLSLTVNGDELIRRGDDTVADPRSVWHGAAWSRYFNDNVGGVKPLPDTQPEPHGQLHPDFAIPLDEDSDGLSIYYENKILTNPRDADTDNNTIPDGQEDFDGDALVNVDEFEVGADPTLQDTDDDRLTDSYEKEQMFFSPVDSMSPYVNRCLLFTNGAAFDFMESPVEPRFNLSSLAFEAWVAPLEALRGRGGYVIRRSRGDDSENNSFTLGINSNMFPYAKFVSGTKTALVVGATAVPSSATPQFLTNWTHLACSYNAATRDLKLFVNGQEEGRSLNAEIPLFGYVTWPVQRVGERFLGAIDEVAIWNTAVPPSWKTTPKATETNLVAYYRFDDGTRQDPTGANGQWEISLYSFGQVQDFVERAELQNNWNKKWLNAASLNGYVNFYVNKYLSVQRLRGDSDMDGIPDAYEIQYPAIMSALLFDSNRDADGDGWDNLAEYLQATEPSSSDSYPKPTLAFDLDCKENALAGGIVVMAYDNAAMSGLPTAQGTFNEGRIARLNVLVYTTTAADEQADRRSFSGLLPIEGSRSIEPGTVQFRGSRSTSFNLSDNGAGMLIGSGSFASDGTIDYKTGAWVININTQSTRTVMAGESVMASWYELTKPTYPRTMTIDTFDAGRLKQGNNWLFVFVDENGNGTYDAGEYAGIPDTQPVYLRYGDYHDVQVGLTRQPAGYGRFSWTAVENASSYLIAVNTVGGGRVLEKTVDRTFVNEWDFINAGHLGLPKSASYQWFVSVSNGPAVVQGMFNVYYPNTPLPAPVTVKPSGVFVANGQVAFEWKMHTNATLFDLEIYNNGGGLVKRILGARACHIDAAGNTVYMPPMYYGYTTGSGDIASLPPGTYNWRVRDNNPQQGAGAWSASRTFSFTMSDSSEGPYSVRGDIAYFGKAGAYPIIVCAYESDGFSGRPYQQARFSKVASTNPATMASITPYTLQALEQGSYYVMAFLDVNFNSLWDSFEPYGFVAQEGSPFKPVRVDVNESKVAQNIELRDVDSDSDGLPDAWEIEHFASLTAAGAGNVRGYTDYDNDGLNDLEEYNRYGSGSDPTRRYSSDDGISDYDKYRVGLSLGIQDTDGDGYPDWLELKTGNDPFNPGCYPDYGNMRLSVAGVNVRQESAAGRRRASLADSITLDYGVKVGLQYQDAIDQDQWQNLGTEMDYTDAVELSDPDADAPARFYRLYWKQVLP